MSAIKRPPNSALKKAKENTTVKIRSNGVEETVKQGIPNEQSRRSDVVGNHSPERIGMNIGSTINMGEYQSLRVDVWYSSDVSTGETVEEAYNRVKEVIDTVLSETVAEYTEE